MTKVEPSRSSVSATVSRLLAELGYNWLPEYGESMHLFDQLGFDSYDGYEMIALVEDEFNFEAIEYEFDDVWTVGDIIDKIVEKVSAGS